MRRALIAIMGTIPLVLTVPAAARAEPWSRAEIARFPDSAFAVIEGGGESLALRHLPHHDTSGALDLPHLRAAISRVGQVRWRDPASEDVARCHLEGHARAAGIPWRSGVACERGDSRP